MIVREYEKIFPNDCPNFDELRNFAESGDFFNLSWRYVQAKNYVGVIRLPSGFQIEILPKIDAPNEKLRGLVIEMLRTLKDFSCKKFLNAELDTERLPLYEIFIQIYLEMISDLVKRGLKSSYIEREENLKFFKGKLLINENLRKNFAHRERFFVSYDEYEIDRPEHRLIKAALLKFRREKLARRLLNHFDSVEASKNYSKDFSAISIDRTNREYQAVMNWTRKILSGESFTPFIGKSEAVALLFDMNKLFEAYVAEYIKKYFSDRFKVKIQAQEKFLFDEPRSFGLKPDIIFEGDEKIILDTKWKFEIAPSDMYQMFAYAKRYGAKKIFLLCPAEENFYRAEDFELKICNVNLFDMETSMNALQNAAVVV
ncbi:MAG: McrC family protein [Selenomonadaceae bacterium]|nr:McrC family protein [Selenomonadaceae bacterium]